MALKILNCKRCGHEWASRRPDRVRVCPKCKSPWWDKEKRIKKSVKKHFPDWSNEAY